MWVSDVDSQACHRRLACSMAGSHSLPSLEAIRSIWEGLAKPSHCGTWNNSIYSKEENRFISLEVWVSLIENWIFAKNTAKWCENRTGLTYFGMLWPVGFYGCAESSYETLRPTKSPLAKTGATHMSKKILHGIACSCLVLSRIIIFFRNHCNKGWTQHVLPQG
jgi:hypothetical protein